MGVNTVRIKIKKERKGRKKSVKQGEGGARAKHGNIYRDTDGDIHDDKH